MPVTAKLSREFCDKFGDNVVDELVGLLNNMDATFKAELRELNEQNCQRFEAKLEQRTAELSGDFRSELGNLRAELGNLKAELIILFWLGTVATMLSFGRFLLTG